MEERFPDFTRDEEFVRDLLARSDDATKADIARVITAAHARGRADGARKVSADLARLLS